MIDHKLLELALQVLDRLAGYFQYFFSDNPQAFEDVLPENFTYGIQFLHLRVSLVRILSVSINI